MPVKGVWAAATMKYIQTYHTT